jgi:hypothetical protein
MFVKITKLSNPDAWYRSKVGQEYEVYWCEENGRYSTLNPIVDRAHGFIRKEDCEIIQ